MRKGVRWRAARSDRLWVERRDRLFATGDSQRFRTLQRRKSRCSKLVVGEEMAQDPERLLQIWTKPFQKLSESRLGHTSDLGKQERVESLEMQSYINEEFLLEDLFSVDEISGAVTRLKVRKVPGPDRLMAEHLKAGGEAVVIWLTWILNAVMKLEAIPEVLKRGIIVPVYKGGGKDPMRTDSYTGITLTSVVSKVLEFLLLKRLEMVLMEVGLPHVNQSAYRRAVSCSDDIFATQEVIARYLRGGSYTCACMTCRKPLTL